MSQQRRALEMAQKVMQSWQGQAPVGFNEAFQAVNQALEQPVQEPYCYVYIEDGEEYFAPKGAYVPDNAQPLYTTPPAQPADHCEDVLHMVRPQNCGTGYCSCIDCLFKKGGK
jgi:hypothetical protein